MYGGEVFFKIRNLGHYIFQIFGNFKIESNNK